MKIVSRHHCQTCGDNRPFDKESASHVLHLLLSVVTGGLWLPLWIICSLNVVFQPYRCRMCGETRWPHTSLALVAVVALAALAGSLLL